MTYPDANDFLMQGGTPAAKFPDIGATIIGMITKPPKMRQVTDPATGEVKRWQSGDPQMQIVIDLQTELNDPTIPDDNGERTLWCKGLMMNAVRDAVRRAGARGLEVGGVIQVTYTGDGEPTKKGFRGPKLYAANYTPPSQAPVAIPEQPVQQAAPQVRQQPVQTQVAARPADPAVAQSFMDRLRAQAANNAAARGQGGLAQDEEPPF